MFGFCVSELSYICDVDIDVICYEKFVDVKVWYFFNGF